MIASVLLPVLRTVVPYWFAAAGGALSERSGVVFLGIEGLMIAGAMGATLGSSLTHSAWIGIVFGALFAGLFGALFAALTLRARANAIVIGVGLNFLASALARVVLQFAFSSSSNSGRVAGFSETLGNPLLWLGLVILPLLALVLERTRFGLRVRAAGENPAALLAAGASETRTRWAAVLVGSVLAGLGGAYLALDQHQFTDGMIAGRGFIALAAVISGSWRPLRVCIACLVFAVAEAAQVHLQLLPELPSQLLSIFPYVATLLVLFGVGVRTRAPSALGARER